MADLVIGSGPAGIAAAVALRARGREVVVVDGGRVLDAEAEARRAALAGSDPQTWSPGTAADWQSPQFSAPPGSVRRFGSDHAMEPAARTFASEDGLALRASRAVGGFSNYWGSAVLPYRDSDLRDWPIGLADLVPHYAAVARFMPVAGQEDALADLFPALDMRGRHAIPAGAQAVSILERWKGAEGVTLGLARQAVGPGCQLCGQCLHGCPWRLIYSAGTTLAGLVQGGGVRHLPGRVVRAIEPRPSGIRLVLADGETLDGDRAFLAAGVLETARILLASLPLGSLRMADSQHAFLPMIQTARVSHAPDRPPLHTLPQLFAEIDDPAVSPWLVHAQIYGWNEYYARDLLANYGRIAAARPLLRALSRRLVVAQMFLHSAHSAGAELRLAGDGRLAATVVAQDETRTILDRAARKLGRAMRPAGVQALRMALRAGAPGSSFHAGATLPMASQAQGTRSDSLGRLAGIERLHVVDASVLPTIPATTITFSVMANAHRIASLAP